MSLPPELITLIVKMYALGGFRRDLSALLSVSRAFRTPARKLFFERVWLAWRVDADQVLPSPRSDLFVDMVSNAPDILRLIKEVSLSFYSASEDIKNPRGVQCPRVAAAISLLCGASVHKLALLVDGSSNIKLHLFSPAVMKGIYDIRLSPSLRSLEIDAATGVPPLLILGRQSEDPLAHLVLERCTSIFDPDDVTAYRSQHPGEVALPNLLSLSLGDSPEADFFVLFQSTPGPLPTQTPTSGHAPDVGSREFINGWFPALKKFFLRDEVSDDGGHVFQTLNALAANAPFLETLEVEIYGLEGFDYEELQVDDANPYTLTHLREVSWRYAEGYALSAIEDFTALIRWLGHLGAPLEKVKFEFHNIFAMDVYYDFDGVLCERFNICSLRPALETLKAVLRDFKSFQQIELLIGSELHYEATPVKWLANCPHEACLAERQQFSVRLGEVFAPLTSITPESSLKTEHTYCGHPSVRPVEEDVDSGSDDSAEAYH